MPESELSRREACGLLAAVIAAPRARGAQGPLHFAALDHVEFTVSDVARSLAFYSGIFGNAVMKNNKTTRRYLKLV